MAKQLHFGNITEGMDVPPLLKTPSARDLVRWAAGSGDFYEVHYDQSFARDSGLPDIIVHGRLKAAYLVQMIAEWIGQGTLRRLAVRYKEVDFPRERLTCRGKVTATYIRDDERWVECEVWTENPKGKQTTVGSVAFTLPQ